MKKPWDELLEDVRTDRLQKLALRSGDEKDWHNYEQALVRHGDVSRALRLLASRATLERLDIVRRLMDQVKGADGQELMATGMVDDTSTTWLVVEVTGNNLRVRKRISMSLLGSRWDTMARLLDKESVSGLSFHVADMRAEDMPGYKAKDVSAT